MVVIGVILARLPRHIRNFFFTLHLLRLPTIGKWKHIRSSVTITSTFISSLDSHLCSSVNRILKIFHRLRLMNKANDNDGVEEVVVQPANSFHCQHRRLSIPYSSTTRIDILLFMYSRRSNAFRHHPPLKLQSFHIPRKPCSHYSRSDG